MKDLPPTLSRTRVRRLVIADDHELTRAGLRNMLARERGIEVVGEAADGRAAIEACRRLHPDLVLLDVRMPEMDGLTATQAIKAAFPEISVIILTFHENPEYLFQAIKAGAAGYLLKDTTRAELVYAIRQVLRGDSILTAEVARTLLLRLSDESTHKDARRTSPLTPRELEVLALVVQGKTNRQIAEILTISPGTAKIHVEHIIGKLGVSDRTQAAVHAVQVGLVHTSGW